MHSHLSVRRSLILLLVGLLGLSLLFLLPAFFLLRSQPSLAQMLIILALVAVGCFWLLAAYVTLTARSRQEGRPRSRDLAERMLLVVRRGATAGLCFTGAWSVALLPPAGSHSEPQPFGLLLLFAGLWGLAVVGGWLLLPLKPTRASPREDH